MNGVEMPQGKADDYLAGLVEGVLKYCCGFQDVPFQFIDTGDHDLALFLREGEIW